RRAIPAITVGGAQRPGTPPGKRILWLSNGANEDLADRARSFCKRLRQSQRCDDLAVLVPPGFEHAGNAVSLAIQLDLRSGIRQNIPLIFGRSASFRYPPAGFRFTLPICTSTLSSSGVTTRFAPSVRSSRLTLSPISVAIAIIAVETAAPSITATATSSLRRG